MSPVNPEIGQEPFWSRFEAWARSPDLSIRTSLSDYRQAWEQGDREDRYAVIEFIRRGKLVADADILAEGIQSDDTGLATHAVANTLSLLADGCNLDRSFEFALLNYGRRNPDRRELSDAALRRLRGD